MSPLVLPLLFCFLAPPEVRLAADAKTIDVAGLSKSDLESLGARKPDDESWPKLLALYVDKGKASGEQLAVLGEWRVEKDLLRFEPRYGLSPGVPYRVVFEPGQLPSRSKDKTVVTTLTIPKPKAGPATIVENVYPTTDKLPENQLKFYLHFSAPMSKGEAYQRVRLLKEDGKAVELPFLELEQELWDRERKRFTLFFDPGRIKRGLKPREEEGPVLEEGKKYTLEIDRRWSDAEGNPLKETFRKTFQVLAPDDAMPDLKKWKLQAPVPGGRGELVVTFDKSLDHALAQRQIWVVDAKGEQMPGVVKVTDKETQWRFVPEKAWTAGSYKLVADTRLEDLAGNSLARPFEVDVFRPVQREVKTETMSVGFEVKGR